MPINHYGFLKARLLKISYLCVTIFFKDEIERIKLADRVKVSSTADGSELGLRVLTLTRSWSSVKQSGQWAMLRFEAFYSITGVRLYTPASSGKQC